MKKRLTKKMYKKIHYILINNVIDCVSINKYFIINTYKFMREHWSVVTISNYLNFLYRKNRKLLYIDFILLSKNINYV